MNKEKLRLIATKKGFRSDQDFAKSISMSASVLSRKMSGKLRFSIAEITQIKNALGLSPKELDEIFFC